MGRLASALLLLLVPGCLDLDKDIACGDGHLEPGIEECDPGVPSSYENECGPINPSRQASCSVPSCTIDFRSCYDPCGNGILDEGEECDPAGADFATDAFEGGGRLCTTTPPLDGGRPYEGGRITECSADCRWDRTPCHRCGNGELDDDEICEFARGDFGPTEDVTAFDSACVKACILPSYDVRPENVRCNAVCDECLDYTVESDPGCCIPSNDPVHPEIPCCGFSDGETCQPGLDGGR